MTSTRGSETSSASALVLAETGDIVADWRELCEWDPMLPPDSNPPIASAVVTAVGAALGRPQPLGWGPDPAVEKVVEVFGTAVGSIDVAIGQLVCLREALRRRLSERLAPEERSEALDRMHMVVDRAIGVAAHQTAGRLEQAALVDELTGLLNRRALERDVRLHQARAVRSATPFRFLLLELEGLARINEREGHDAGDAALRELASAVLAVLDPGLDAYRVGGDQFVIVYPAGIVAPLETVVRRMRAAGAPPFSWSTAAYPDDGQELRSLLTAADRRIMTGRRTAG